MILEDGKNMDSNKPGTPIPRDDYFGKQNDKPLAQRIEEFGNAQVTRTGRLLYRRNTVFADLLTEGEIKQLFIDKGILQNHPEIELGDILTVSGINTYSKKDHPMLAVHEYSIENRPVIASYKFNSEIEAVNPFIEALRNGDERARLINSHRIPQAISIFLNNMGFLDVQTSALSSVDVGLGSKPMQVKGNEKTLRRDFELETRAYLLIHPNVYQIGQVFRDQGVSNKNRNDFLYANIYFPAHKLEDIYSHMVGVLNSTTQSIGMEPVIPRVIHFEEFILSEMGFIGDPEAFMSWFQATHPENKDLDYYQALHRCYKLTARKKVTDPTIVVGFPSHALPFARSSGDDSRMAQDIRLLWNGQTIMHGSLEIFNYDEQVASYRAKFGDGYFDHLSEGEIRYLEILKYGLPPFAGLSVSVDLLSKILTASDNVNGLRPSII